MRFDERLRAPTATIRVKIHGETYHEFFIDPTDEQQAHRQFIDQQAFYVFQSSFDRGASKEIRNYSFRGYNRYFLFKAFHTFTFCQCRLVLSYTVPG
uniref:Uncharacterized protein n=1 Tax=Tetranychus urticae TaxID=32264 RepID=T1JR32_TETUR